MTGENRGRSGIFKDAQVKAIRERYAQGGVSVSALARRLEVSEQTIRALLRGITYKDVGGPLVEFVGVNRRSIRDEDVYDALESL